MKFYNRKFLYFILFIGIAAAISACGGAENVAGVSSDSSGRALGGYDAVAYFVVQTAVEGNPKYEYAWNGAKWLFSSEENMKKFQQNPESYAPQYGGYCSYAVSEGYTASGDPKAWKVTDGKLYLNYNPQVKETWEKNEAERIEKGTKNWSEFQKKKPEHKG